MVVSACGRVHEPKGLPGGHTEEPDAGIPADASVEADGAAPDAGAGCGADTAHEELPDASGCAPACTVGAKRCGPRGALQICALDDAMCPSWVTDTSCGAGRRCKTKPAEPGIPPMVICCTQTCAGKCGGDDGCGGTCPDTCTSPDSCGGGGTPNVCGCTTVIAEVAAGGRHTCARKQDRTVWCWGGFNASTAPAQITALGNRATQISAGAAHTCAVLKDGTLWCWGFGDDGQLGDGNGVGSPTPVQVASLDTNVASVGAGAFHTCAVLKDRTLWCWGLNQDGQLGDGTTTSRLAPVPIGLTAVKQAAPGSGSSCAVKQDGTLWCWGRNDDGQLGQGNRARSLVPLQVTALGAAVTQADVGVLHACALKQDGTLWCWGTGALGNGTTESLLPVQVTALGTSVAAVSAGQFHTCARETDSTLWCWGGDGQGQVGQPPTPQFLTPVQVDALGATVAQVSAGDQHTCALKQDGALFCWGSNQFGQLAEPLTTELRSTPAQITLGCAVP
jgi:alpha-tubulin suppressor-like RCC1 family protein